MQPVHRPDWPAPPAGGPPAAPAPVRRRRRDCGGPHRTLGDRDRRQTAPGLAPLDLGRAHAGRARSLGAKATAIAAGAGAVGWRARRPARSSASTRAAVRRRASTSATRRARWRSARARCGSSTAPTARSSRSTDTNSVSARRRRPRPTAVAVGEGAVGLPAARTAASPVDQGRARSSGVKTGSSLSALAVAERLGVDRRGRARGGAPGRNAAGGHPADGAGHGPSNWLHEDGLLHLRLDGGGARV